MLKEMTSRKRVAAVLAAAVLVSLIIVAWANRMRDEDRAISRVSKSNNVALVYPDYEVYDSPDVLLATADAVIVAEVEDVLPSRVQFAEGAPSKQVSKEAGKAAGGGKIVTHDVVYRVENVLVGDLRSKTRLKVRELGGSDGTIEFIIHGQRRVRPGHRHLLALKRVGDGIYSILGGEQGRYVINAGRVSSEGVSDLTGAQEGLDGMTLARVETLVKGLDRNLRSRPAPAPSVGDSGSTFREPPTPESDATPRRKPFKRS